MGGYFFISTMVYNTMIRIKAMYSIVSTPSRKKGQKASPLQNQRGKTANRMATPVCIVADDTGKRNKHNKKAAGNPAAFHLYQNHSAGTNPGHHFPLRARNCVQAQPG